MSETVRYVVSDGVATVTLNRPERLNAMNVEMVEAVLECVERAASDDDVRVVVMTGEGRAFCAGGDLTTVADIDHDAPVQRKVTSLQRHHRISELLQEMPKVTIAAVNGPCAGAGLAWACAADLRIAAESAVFRTAFISAAMTGDFGGTWTLSRLVGPAKARELYLLNDKIGAPEALSIGLVNRITADEDLDKVVAEIAAQMTAAAPLAVKGIKDNLNDALRLDFATALDREAERHIRVGYSEDTAEAAAAFLEKRAPAFQGR